MKKNILILIFICLLGIPSIAQSPKIDTVAVAILDRMSGTISELKSFSVVVKSNYDISSQDLGLVKHSDEEHLYVAGSDKLMVGAEGDKGNRDFYYNGKTFTYYSLEKNHFAQTNAPASVVTMVDSMNKNYGIIFPAADFLYPDFVNDILAETANLAYLGMTRVNDKVCFHIAGVSKDKTFQFWISDAPFYLPLKLVIVYTDKPLNPQFEATYTDWQLNPGLTNSIFEFKAPPNAKKIKFTTKSEKK